MDLNSRLFDRIRVKPAERAPEKAPTTPCSFPGCSAEGVFRAPKGREREGEYFSFCRDHVREYNASYDYFRGMDDASMARYRQADAVGHRPTWKMGARVAAAGQPVDESVFAEARAARRRGAKGKAPQTEPPVQRPGHQGLVDARTWRRRDSSENQGAIQGIGETPPSGRERGRSFVGRKIARDHSGLQFPARQ
jgi:hypothetical protein